MHIAQKKYIFKYLNPGVKEALYHMRFLINLNWFSNLSLSSMLRCSFVSALLFALASTPSLPLSRIQSFSRQASQVISTGCSEKNIVRLIDNDC